MTRFHRSRLARSLAGFASLVLASAAFAQGTTLTGTVKSAQGQALQAANVRIRRTNASVGTDGDGGYRITLDDSLRGQTVTLTVRAMGFIPQSKEITISAGQQRLDFMLDTDGVRVSEVVVRPNEKGGKTLVYTLNKADTARRITADSARNNRWRIASNDPADLFAQHLYPPEMIMQNQARLRITESQRDAILQEISKVQATATQVQWRVSEESEKLNQLLERENVQESEVLAQADRLMNGETAVKRAQLTMLIRIRNLLTPEQRAMLRDMRRRE